MIFFLIFSTDTLCHFQNGSKWGWFQLVTKFINKFQTEGSCIIFHCFKVRAKWQLLDVVTTVWQ